MSFDISVSQYAFIRFFLIKTEFGIIPNAAITGTALKQNMPGKADLQIAQGITSNKQQFPETFTLRE
jgi:hypothetical protein